MPHLLVVGAGPGIAAATARRFGREGYAVGLVARREEALAELIIAGTGDLGGVAQLIDRITTAHTERMRVLGLNP